MNQNKETVTIYLPPEGGQFAEGAINGVNFRVKTGTVVEVPAQIAAVLIDSRRASEIAEDAVGAFTRPGGVRL